MFKIQFINRLTMQSTGGSVVEFSPATREARVRFPASAVFFLFPFYVFCFALNDVNLWLVTPRTYLKIWFVFIQKKFIPLFQKLFLGILDHSRLIPTPFLGKRVIAKSLLWTKFILYLYSPVLIFKNLHEDSFWWWEAVKLGIGLTLLEQRIESLHKFK